MNKQSIAAIVVTYNIGKSYLKNFNSLINQVDKIFIIDNNSDKETIKVLKEIAKNNKEKVEVVFNDKNEGLAKAQNKGVKLAKLLKVEWILLLDNDSTLEKKMVSTMIEKYSKYDLKNQVGIISPMIVDINSSRKTKYICKEGFLSIKRKELTQDITDTVLCTIASGSLIKLELIDKIGLFKEDYFIDSIDTEFCMRTIFENYKILVIKDAILYHELGEKKDFKVLGINLTPSNHSSLRRYYMYRNRVKMWKEYRRKAPKYVVYEMLASLYQFILIVCLEENKKQKVKMILKGLKEGLKNN